MGVDARRNRCLIHNVNTHYILIHYIYILIDITYCLCLIDLYTISLIFGLSILIITIFV